MWIKSSKTFAVFCEEVKLPSNHRLLREQKVNPGVCGKKCSCHVFYGGAAFV